MKEIAAMPGGMTAFVIALLIGVAIAGLIVGIVLKFVGQAILKHTVRFDQAFTAAFTYALIGAAIQLVILFAGLATVAATQGTTWQIVSLAIGVVILGLMIQTFVKSPDGAKPALQPALIVSIATLAVFFVLGILLRMAGIGAGA